MAEEVKKEKTPYDIISDARKNILLKGKILEKAIEIKEKEKIRKSAIKKKK
jgi:hypothetical protein